MEAALSINSVFNQSIGTNNYDWWNPHTYEPIVHHYYQPSWWLWETDRTGKAMRLIQTMIEKKLIKEPKTVGQFIELVNEVSKLI